MAKKSYISLLFLLAFSVLFMHSVIPHHHKEEITHQHGSDDDDHDDLDHNPLSHAFGSFQHDGTGTVIYESPTSVQYAKVNFDKETVLVIQYFLKTLRKPPQLYSEHHSVTYIPTPGLVVQLFRGPPASQA